MQKEMKIIYNDLQIDKLIAKVYDLVFRYIYNEIMIITKYDIRLS